MRHKPVSLLLIAGVLFTAAAAAISNTPAPGAASHGPLPALAPESRQSLVEQSIAGFLTRYQYEHRALDNSLSPQIFDLYLKDLDPNRSYFLQSDIDSFAPYRSTLDDAIHNGDLKPAF